MNVGLLNILVLALRHVPLTHFRMTIHEWGNERLLSVFTPSLLTTLFIATPHLKTLCLDHAPPFARSQDGGCPWNLAWPGPWETWAAAFAHAQRLETFIGTIFSVQGDTLIPFRPTEASRLSSGWGFKIGRAVRARTKALFAACLELRTVLLVAAPGMPDYAETRSVSVEGREKYSSRSGDKLMLLERFWMPLSTRDVTTYRHQRHQRSDGDFFTVYTSEIFGKALDGQRERLDGLMKRIWDTDFAEPILQLSDG